jgi:hypothetical protein
VAISGLSSTISAAVTDYWWNPTMSSAYPMYAAGVCGAIGCVAMLVLDGFRQSTYN